VHRNPARVTLRDGSTVLIRPIQPGDKETLERGFARLSEDSRYTRFLAPMNRLSPSMLAYLTEVDHHDHEALVAIDDRSGEGVGVARYVRTEGAIAEAAVTVADEWQGLGLGTALTSMLAERALEEGIERLTAIVLAENHEMIDLLESVGQVETREREGATLTVEVPLEPRRPGAGKGLYGLLRAARRVAASLRASEPSSGGSPPEPR
jgi:GNAT superfamily N-acetyltransferase